MSALAVSVTRELALQHLLPTRTERWPITAATSDQPSSLMAQQKQQLLLLLQFLTFQMNEIAAERCHMCMQDLDISRLCEFICNVLNGHTVLLSLNMHACAIPLLDISRWHTQPFLQMPCPAVSLIGYRTCCCKRQMDGSIA